MSRARIADGYRAVLYATGFRKLPVPVPSRTENVCALKLTTARSGLVSAFRSAETMLVGPARTAKLSAALRRTIGSLTSEAPAAHRLPPPGDPVLSGS